MSGELVSADRLREELATLNRWNAAVMARQGMTCDREASWGPARFLPRCYFYPGRDCPGWLPGQVCGRIDRRIPDE
jgi:hypothetical protein